MSYPQKLRDLIEAEQFLGAARFAAAMPDKPKLSLTWANEPEKYFRIRTMTGVVEAAFVAGAWDQLRAIKDDPACAPFLSEQTRYRIQDETPTLVMRVPVLPTEFDEDAQTNPRGTVVAG